jgi:hypothetical protein
VTLAAVTPDWSALVDQVGPEISSALATVLPVAGVLLGISVGIGLIMRLVHGADDDYGDDGGYDELDYEEEW